MVIFDFDGVIVDTFCVGCAINQIYHPELTEDDYRKKFHGNINVEMKKYKESRGEHVPSDHEWFDHYGRKVKEMSVVAFEGMPDVVKKLGKKFDLAIVSSTKTKLIEEMLENYGLGEYFDCILGNDIHHHKSEKFKMIFEKFDLKPSDCIFVTDTLGDLREANEVDLKTIVVTWGFNDEDALKRGNPYKIAHTPEELSKEILEYLAGVN